MPKKSVMLAPNDDIPLDDRRIKYPILGSPKFDGIRCVCVGGELLTRSMRQHANQTIYDHLRSIVELCQRQDLVLDMELYDETLPDFGSHLSILRSKKKEIPATMRAHVFDCMTLSEWESSDASPFEERLKGLHLLSKDFADVGGAVEHVNIESPEEAQLLFEMCVEDGYEGSILRDPGAGYKHGRATLKEGSIFKVKPFETTDGVIIGLTERQRLKDGVDCLRRKTPTGHEDRIHTKAAYEPAGLVGAILVRLADGTESEINYGRGFDMSVRKAHWEARNDLIGKVVEIRHMKHGATEGIRIGQLVRFRDDLSASDILNDQ